MRILFLSREYPPDTDWGGIATRLSITAKALASKGHEVHVLSCVDNQKVRDYVEDGVYVHRREQIHIKGAKRIFKDWLNLPETLQRLKSGLSNFIETRRLKLGHIDIVEYPDYGAEGWCFTLVKKYKCVCRMASPIFVNIEFTKNRQNPDVSTDISLASKFEHFGVRRAGIVISPASYLVDRLKINGWLKGIEPQIIPNIIDWRRWTDARPVLQTQPVILFVGRLEWNKAPEVLVNALAMIRKEIPSARAIFIGRSGRTKDGENYLEWMKRELNSIENCEFIGEVKREYILDYMSQARVFALPSWSENYSNAVLEAMASERPVVIGQNSGIAELIRDTNAGKIIPPGNPVALAKALIPYLRNVESAQKAGTEARKKVKEVNDSEVIISKIVETYKSMITN
jgi:glycogen synthase